MIALVAAATLAAAVPRPLPNADSGAYIPRLDQLEPTLGFMHKAGQRSVLLRPSTWFADAHPLLYLDFTRPESLQAAGIAPNGSATVSFAGEARMTCVDVADMKLFEQRAKERVQTYGVLWEGKLAGASVVAAKLPDGTLRGGYAKRGKVTCSVMGTSDGAALLNAAARAAGSATLKGSWKELKGLEGAAFIVVPEGVAGLRGEGDTLTVSGKTSKFATPALERKGTSPYVGMKPAGMAMIRTKVKREEVPVAVTSITSALSRMCKSCSSKEIASIEKRIAAQLTGNVALAVSSLNMRSRLKTDSERFFAARHTWLAEVKDVTQVELAIAPLGMTPGGRKTSVGYAVAVEGGDVLVGVHQNHLFLSNDSEALTAVLQAIPAKGGELSHGLEFELDPQRTARSLGQIGLFDVMGSKELAGLFAVSTELGPLLSVSKAVQGWADTAGPRAHRFGLTWTLQGE